MKPYALTASKKNMPELTEKKPANDKKYLVYKWYMLPIGGLYTTYHPLQEPVKSIDETNIAPENKPSQKESHGPTTIIQGRAVSFRQGTRTRCGYDSTVFF